MPKRGGGPGYTIVELLMAIALVGLVAAAVAGAYQVAQQNYMRASSLEAAQVGARAGLDRMANELRLIGSFWVGANGAGNPITNATATSITFKASVNDLYMLNASAVEATVSSITGNNVTLSLTGDATDEAFKIYTTDPTVNNDYAYIANGGNRDVRRITQINGSTLTIESALSVTYPVGSLVRDVKTITYARNPAATATCPALTCLTRTQGGSDADPIVDNVTGLTFVYYDSNGGVLPPGNAEPAFCGAGLPNPDLGLIREIRVDLKVQSPDGSARCMITKVRPRSLL